MRDAIDDAGGWISFARYMELVLYAPGLGYYTAGAAKLGAPGDFVTAPELSPLFGATLARQVAQVLAVTGGDVLELGAGSGRLALDTLLALDELGAVPDRYLILDLSADLIERQRATLAALPPALRQRVEWITGLPPRLRGVVLGNEVLDALPVHLVSHGAPGWMERGVAIQGDGFAWRERDLEDAELARRLATLAPAVPYITEVGLAGEGLVRSLARSLDAGMLLLIDYGFGAAEYYHPQRCEGTVMCHYRHRAHDDVFLLPGLQDITAHVNFSAVATAAVESGLRLAGYTSQARFLANLGITDLMARVDPRSEAFIRMAAPIQKLLSPAEMGELFKVIALVRGIETPLAGFARGTLDRLL